MDVQEPSAHARRPRRARRRIGPGLLVLAGLVVAWYVIAWLRHGPPVDGRIDAIAHRGAPRGSGAPENTLPAFRAAIEAGADWLEFDVRRTLDGVLVVLHDKTLERTLGEEYKVADLTLAQLRALKGGETIPTVEAVVDIAAAADVPILPEIKAGPSNPGMTGQLVDLLRAKGYLDRAVVLAFEADTLDELRRIAPDARACWLTHVAFDVTQPPADAAYVCPMGETLLLHPDMIRAAHADGRTVFAWWLALESPATNAVLKAFGVDGIIVDDLASLD